MILSIVLQRDDAIEKGFKISNIVKTFCKEDKKIKYMSQKFLTGKKTCWTEWNQNLDLLITNYQVLHNARFKINGFECFCAKIETSLMNVTVFA